MEVKNRLKCLSILFAMFAALFLIATPNASALTKNIKVADVNVKEKSGTIIVADPVLSDNEITSNITFNKKDDFATFELSLENNESEKYKIESISDNNTNENIEIDYSFSEDYIDAGELGAVTIKLTYKNTLNNVDKISIDDLMIKIYLINEDGEGGEIIINPTTGDALPFYCILFAAALAGLVVLLKNKKSKAIKVCGVLFALSLLFIPLTTLAKEKNEVQIKFTDIDIIGEFETYNISINPGNGDEILVVPVQYGDKLVSLPANPSKDGYDFDKWVDEDGNTVTSDTVITKPITIEAQYTVKKYAIDYDLNGGSLPEGKTNPSEYTIEDEITINNPEKLGYTFIGWSGTGIDEKTTNLVIPVGSKDARNYLANYSANKNTPYTVTHRYQNLNDLSTYAETTVTEYGETDKIIPAPRQERTGFETPAVQNVKVEADGSAHITYTYDRESYSFSITDRTYVTSDSTSDGSYLYETVITAKAKERAGYTFAWNDGDTNYERTFELTGTVSLTPVYTAKTNTKYVVKHYKQKLTLDGYEIADTQNLTGTTDAPIEPAVNSYTGFKSPAVQHTTIAGDESTAVNYYYDRESYTVTFNTDGGSTVAPQTVIYGKKATRPAEDPIKNKATFDGWYTTDSYGTLFDFSSEITSDTTIYAKFIPDSFAEVFRQTGECTFNGVNGVITGDGCAYANGINKYIDTGINLYNEENHDKDYEIGFTIVSYKPADNVRQATFMNTKLEGGDYPGLVFRKYNDNSQLDFSSRRTSTNNSTKYWDTDDVVTMRIYRITNETTGIQEIFYSVNGSNKVKINDLSKFNPVYNLSVWFGATPVDATAETAHRHLVGTLSDMYIKLGTYEEEPITTYKVRLNANSGSVSPIIMERDKGVAIGDLPTPTTIPEGKQFDGWYSKLEGGSKISSSYTSDTDVTIYARYIDAN